MTTAFWPPACRDGDQELPKNCQRRHVCSLSICRTFRIARLLALSWSPACGAGGGETIDQALCRMIEGAAAIAPPAGRFLHPADLAGKQLPAGVTAGRARRASRSSCPGPRPSAALPIRSIPSRRSRNRPSCWRPAAALRQSRAGGRGLQWRAGARRSLARGARRAAGETRNYVSAITGRGAEDWARGARHAAAASRRRRRAAWCWSRGSAAGRRRRVVTAYSGPIEESPIAPWGVQLAGNFSKAVALASYARARERHAAILERRGADGDRHADAQPRHARVLSRAHSGGDARRRRPRSATRLHKAGGAVRGVEELRLEFRQAERSGQWAPLPT